MHHLTMIARRCRHLHATERTSVAGKATVEDRATAIGWTIAARARAYLVMVDPTIAGRAIAVGRMIAVGLVIADRATVGLAIWDRMTADQATEIVTETMTATACMIKIGLGTMAWNDVDLVARTTRVMIAS